MQAVGNFFKAWKYSNVFQRRSRIGVAYGCARRIFSFTGAKISLPPFLRYGSDRDNPMMENVS